MPHQNRLIVVWLQNINSFLPSSFVVGRKDWKLSIAMGKMKGDIVTPPTFQTDWWATRPGIWQEMSSGIWSNCHQAITFHGTLQPRYNSPYYHIVGSDMWHPTKSLSIAMGDTYFSSLNRDLSDVSIQSKKTLFAWLHLQQIRTFSVGPRNARISTADPLFSIFRLSCSLPK